MVNKSYEWKVRSNCFIEVDDPAVNNDEIDVDERIIMAGYTKEISSNLEGGMNATISIYATNKEDKPRFYIDVMGQNNGIATFVAQDFLMLLETLKQIQPLISLLGLDQMAMIHFDANTAQSVY